MFSMLRKWLGVIGLISLCGCAQRDPARPSDTNPRNPTEVRITDMKSGDTGWTVPWAMFADNDGRLWLRDNYTVRAQPGGTVQMMVTKLGDRLVVDLQNVDDRWNRPRSKSSSDGLPVYGLAGSVETTQSVLPEKLRQRVITDLQDGESSWTVPWAMSADQDGRLWLNPDYSISEPGGTVQLKVTKTAGEFVVDVRPVHRHRWLLTRGNNRGVPVKGIYGSKDDNQSVLPETLRQRIIADLGQGESGWTVPWAVVCDRDGNLFIDEGYSLHEAAGGTVQLRVTRSHDGYRADGLKDPHKTDALTDRYKPLTNSAIRFR